MSRLCGSNDLEQRREGVGGEMEVKMKKIAVILVITIFVTMVAVYALAQSYQPGNLTKNTSVVARLNPPEQDKTEKDHWRVEKRIKLFHFSDGRGRKVLMVHGGPGYPFTEPWKGLRLINKDYEFTYYHQRGCGKSTRPIKSFKTNNFMVNANLLEFSLGLTTQIADIERIRRITGQEKLILIGHSFGAFLSAFYAVEFPEKVDAMILISPADVLVFPQESGGLYDLVEELLPEDMEDDYADFFERYFDFGEIFSKTEDDLIALNAEFEKYYRAAYESTGMQLPKGGPPGENGGWMVHAMFLSMGMQHDYRPALRNVKAPVLIIHGDKDLMPLEASKTYAELLPNSRLVVIHGAGHFSFEETPEEFAKVVASFLKNNVTRQAVKKR